MRRLIGLLLVLPLAGCGLKDPYAESPGKTAPPASTQQPRIVDNEVQPERRVDDPAASPTAQGADTPKTAITRFAQLYTNWDYRTLVRTRKQLAAISVGSAHAAQLRAARELSTDTTIRTSKVVNRGRVVSIATDDRQPGVWVVVTRESTVGVDTYEGLAPSFHVTLVRVRRLDTGTYAVSTWAPQS